MTYTTFTNINQLEEFSFVGGNDYYLDFTVYQSDGITPMDLGGATIYWVLAPYGQPDYKVAQLTATMTPPNQFRVEIPSAISAPLSGKYTHQPVIVSFGGTKEYRPCQGIVLIMPQIPRT